MSACTGTLANYLGTHVRQAKFCLQVFNVFFLGGSPVFAPPIDRPVSYELK